MVWARVVPFLPVGIYSTFCTCRNYACSALTLLVGREEEHPACRNWVMSCCCGYLSGARFRLFAYGPADASAIRKHRHLLASFESRLVLPFWNRLAQVVPENRPLNGCGSTVVVHAQSRRSKLRRVLRHSGRRSAATWVYGATRPAIPNQSSTGRETTATGDCPTEPTSSGSVAALFTDTSEHIRFYSLVFLFLHC